MNLAAPQGMGLALAAFDDGAGPVLHLGGAFLTSPAGDAYLAKYGCPPAPPVVAYCSGDGSGTACPCGNPGAPGHGCGNSVSSAGAQLSWSGTASVLAGDLRLHGSGMPDQPCLYFQGTTQVAAGAGAVFGDGLRCAGGAVIRLGVKLNSGGASSCPEPGDPALEQRGSIPPCGGVTRTYQCWYRDSGSCSGAGFNLTGALLVQWVP